MSGDVRAELDGAGQAPAPPPREGFVADLERRLRGLPRPAPGEPGPTQRPSLAATLGPLLVALALLVALVVLVALAA